MSDNCNELDSDTGKLCNYRVIKPGAFFVMKNDIIKKEKRC